MGRIVSEQEYAGLSEMTFAEKHPWLVVPVDKSIEHVPRRFTNEYCAAQSVWCKGTVARKWLIRNERTGVTYDWIKCLEMTDRSFRSSRLSYGRSSYADVD